MATVTVKQNALVLNAFAATFQNNLVASDLVSWRQYDGEMNERNGLQVIEQVGPRYNVYETTDGVKDLSAGVQDSVFGSEIFKVNKTFNSSMGWGDFVKIRDINDARESVALKSAATRLAEYIDAYILNVATLASNNWVGTADGVNVADYSDVARAYTRLKKEGVDDSDLRMALTYDDRESLASTIIGYSSTDDGMSQFREGFAGKINGIPTVFTQQLPSLTMGTRAASGANVNIPTGAQNVNYADVAQSAAPGQYMTQTLDIRISAAGTETVKAGEVFTIAGVKAWDNRLGAVQDHLQQFRVIADATAAAGLVTVRVFPAMIIGDNDVNSAHRTVDAVPANGALITFVGTASTAYRPRLLIQKDAIEVNTARLPDVVTGISSRKSLTKVPLQVRMWQHSDFGTGAHSVRFDVALTANVRDRRRITRFNGVA